MRPYDGAMQVLAPTDARVVQLPLAPGESVAPDDVVVVLEVMKMEMPLPAGILGRVAELTVSVGDTVRAGDLLVTLVETDGDVEAPRSDAVDDSTLLDEAAARHALTRDAARPEAVARRHRSERRTARENVSDLCGEFVEYGPLAIAAQRQRRDLQDLIERTPADGMIGGVGRIDTGVAGEDRTIVVSYDFTVLAGTQGMQNHRKKDRLFTLAAETQWPVVLFAEGGGGRPGDVDWPGASLLDVPAFRLFSEIPGPTIGINNGYCFAGNAALLGQCDVIVATEDSNLGMGGPAMIAGGGLGDVPPAQIGPADVQTTNGVIDVLIDDDVAAVKAAKALLGIIRGWLSNTAMPDQELLRETIPTNRKRVYDVRALIGALVDTGTFLELRPRLGRAAVTGFARIDGHPIGIVANDPGYLAGAIDHEAATTMARHMRLCDRWRVPLLFLCDTPGFMVGPEAEAEGLVRSAGGLFRAAAAMSVPTGTIVTRRGYGLGAQAMAGGGFHENRFTIGWPASEFGPMGIEGAVKLGFSKELAAIADSSERDAKTREMIDEMYMRGRGLNVATHFEIDDVIDPADSRRWIQTLLLAA
jgi:acetyl-CoA carboxylase carboxyltransferase component